MKKRQIMSLKKPSRLLLRIALPMILLVTVAITISYLDARSQDPVLANLYYPAFLEYIFASLLITACGVFLIEIAERDVKR